MEEDMILPEGFESTPTEETTEVTETPEENTEFTENEVVEEGTPTEAPQQNEPFLKITYNKQEVPLTQEEVITLSQKGMNYDKLMSKYEEVQNNAGLQYLNDLAQRNGMQVDELVGYWKQQEEQSQLNELLQKNIPEEYAREMIESRKFREQQQQQLKQKEAETQRENQWKQQQEAFLDKYPNVAPDKIPQMVWDEWKQGKDLVSAYTDYENEELKKELAVLKQNSKNKSTSPIKGGISKNGSNEVGSEDAFMRGFNSI